MDLINVESSNLGLVSNMGPNDGLDWHIEGEIGEGFSMKSLDDALNDEDHIYGNRENSSDRENE